jgi:hypothetical protein
VEGGDIYLSRDIKSVSELYGQRLCKPRMLPLSWADRYVLQLMKAKLNTHKHVCVPNSAWGGGGEDAIFRKLSGLSNVKR